MEERFITQEEYAEDFVEMQELLKKAKEQVLNETYEERTKSYVEFIENNAVKKIGDKNNG